MSTESPIKLYDFTQIVVGTEAFIGNLEKKVQEIHPEIPVFVLNGGDSTYLFRKKFEKIEPKEIYLKNPRIVLDVDELALQTDQNTNQYMKIQYLMNEELYEATFRRQATTIPITCNFVTPNWVKGLEYFSLISSLLSIDNTYTYDFLGNNYDASYNATNYSFEKAPTDASSAARNFIVKANIELTLQIVYVRYNTIRKLNPHDTNTGGIKFEINTKNNDGTSFLSTLKNPNDECDCTP